MNKKFIAFLFIAVLVSIGVAACGSGTGTSASATVSEKKVSDTLTVTLSSVDGKLKNGEQNVTLKFTDGAGKPVEISAASLNFNMPAMGSMAEMNDAATLTTTGTPGEFSGSVKLQMAGDWMAQIKYEGKENGETSMPVTAQ